MGKNIKIELELPEFERELVVSVILKRDGEAITASSDPGVSATLQGDPGRTGLVMNNEESGSAWKQEAPKSPIAPKAARQPKSQLSFPKVASTSQATSGNMMDMNF